MSGQWGQNSSMQVQANERQLESPAAASGEIEGKSKRVRTTPPKRVTEYALGPAG